MNKVLDFLKRLFVDNWKMKLIALVFAFVLWSFMITETNPPKSKIFHDIPVTFTATEELRLKGYTTTELLSDVLKGVTVEAETNADALQYLNENMIRASVDLSSINGEGEYTLPVQATSTLSQSRIVRVEPSTVTIVVEEIVSKDVPIEVQMIGTKEDWLYYGEPILENPMLEISGARSDVEAVGKAICYVDINGLESSVKQSYPVTLVDVDGSEVSSDTFTGVAAAIVEIPIYPIKEVTVDAEAAKENVTGIPDGYEITNFEVSASVVNIAGPLDKLEGIDAVELDPISVEETGEIVIDVPVSLADGIVAAIPAQLRVTMTVEQPEIMRNYPAKRIGITNLEPGLHAVVRPESIDVEVYGTQSAFDDKDITSDKILPFVDLSGLGVGTHKNIALKFENEPDLGVRLQPSQLTVEVVIYAEDEE